MLTLDEAIKHCEEKAKAQRSQADYYHRTRQSENDEYRNGMCQSCLECASEHEQLAGWLKDYKRLLEMPKGDLISRKWLTDAIRNRRTYLSYEDAKDVIDLIDNAPTVEITETEVQEVLNKRCMTAVANEYLIALHGKRPQGEYVPISKLRLMTVEECAGHTIDYAMGWKACIEWLKKGGADMRKENDNGKS